MVLPAAGCVVVSFIAALGLLYCFRRIRFVFEPGRLDIHRQPSVPAGGTALLCSIAAFPVLAGISMDVNLLGACLFFFLGGFWDDLKKARPELPLPVPGPAFFLTFETLVAAWYGLASGIPGNAVGVAALVLWCHLIVNGMNMLDGLNGLAGTVALTASVCLLVLFKPLNPGCSEIFLLISLAAGVAGTLPMNIAGGRLFFGNSGARLMGGGLALASYPFLTGHRVPGVGLPVVIILILPLFELLYNSARRMLSGGAPWIGDLEHPYNKLASKWGSRIVAVLIYAGVAVAAGAAGLLFSRIASLYR